MVTIVGGGTRGRPDGGRAQLGPSVSDAEDPDGLVGRIGRVSIPIPADGPGEILVPIRGGTEAYAAWADEPVGKHHAVVVVEVRAPRSVSVTPFPEADPL